MEIPLAQIPELKPIEPVPDLSALVSAAPPAAPPLPRARAHYVPPPSNLEPEPLSGNPFGDDDSVSIPQPAAPVAALPKVAPVVEPQVEAPGLGSASEPLTAEDIRISIQPVRSRGSAEITAMLAIGVLLLSVTAAGQVFRRPAATPTVISTPPSPAENASTAQLFLDSAKKSLAARDYELAASQIEKAVQELEASAASEIELGQARLALARALQGKGDIEEALEVCQDVVSGELKKEKTALVSELKKALRKGAQGLLASGRQDLAQGDTSLAGEKAREATRIFTRHGGSAEQVADAKSLAQAARRAEAKLGLQRRPVARREVPDEPRSRRPQPDTGVRRSYFPEQPAPRQPAASLPRPSSGYPTGPAGQSPSEEFKIPVIPHIPHQSRRQPGQAEGPPAQAPPSEAPAQQQMPSGVRQVPPPAYQGESGSSRRDRAGDTDVVPTYKNNGGGSVY